MSQTICPKCKSPRSQVVECYICGEKWDLIIGSSTSREAELMETVTARDATIAELKRCINRLECDLELAKGRPTA